MGAIKPQHGPCQIGECSAAQASAANDFFVQFFRPLRSARILSSKRSITNSQPSLLSAHVHLALRREQTSFRG
ncbi:hypothetical protein LshimejAT787_0102820 [Lyophyllum shimeji]|uniref:Uncharacterized protein n=1 Tax=Lyophyllum shimeji TaxID=47721 RepID=A0A9P3UHR1_LYOSH|nr:hypothetical protein LshimejAT787_0102820 [Lyophyllum shimeji]